MINKEKSLLDGIISRGEALEWWGTLDKKTQIKLATKHKPIWDFVMVDTSSSTIESIFNKEIKQDRE
jgi:hypothetical protein